MSITTLQSQDIYRIIAELNNRIKTVEAMLQGQPITTVRIKDLAVTDAKIDSLSADKITSGQLNVSTTINIGSVAGGDYILIDGGNDRIVMYKSSTAQLVIGNI